MKMMTELNQLESSGLSETSEFSIASSTAAKAKAFKILAAGYAHKIRAVIREYGTNCLDAHVINGQTRPFEVTLPSKLHPHLSIRDFGPGLSKGDFTGLYTTLFESTKIHSNDFNGAMGLGSKSAFSYTDQYTGISRFGGKKTTYAIYMNQSRIPAVSVVGEEDSDEETGIEIIIPVRPADIQFFIDEAAYVYYWFKNRPIIKNAPGFRFNANMTVIKETPEYILNSAHFGVLMSDVFYPIDRLSLSNEIAEIGTLAPYNIVLKMPNGSCDFTPTREALSFDPVTVKNVLKALKSAIAEIEEMPRWFMQHATPFQIERYSQGFEKFDTTGFGGGVYANVVKFYQKKLQLDKDHVFEVVKKLPKTSVIKISAEGSYIRVTRKKDEGLILVQQTEKIYVGRTPQHLEQARRHMFANGISSGVYISDDYWRSVTFRYPAVTLCWELPAQPPRTKQQEAPAEKVEVSFWTVDQSKVIRHHFGMKNYARKTLAQLQSNKTRYPLVPASRGVVDEDTFGYSAITNLKTYFRAADRDSHIVVLVSPNMYDATLAKYPELFFDPRIEAKKYLSHPQLKTLYRLAALETNIETELHGVSSSILAFGGDPASEKKIKELRDLFASWRTVLKDPDVLEAFNYLKAEHDNRPRVLGRLYKFRIQKIFKEFKNSLNDLEAALFEHMRYTPDEVANVILRMRKERIAA